MCEEAMTWAHPQWDLFVERLGGPEGCNGVEIDGETRWWCGGSENAFGFASHILWEMGFSMPEIRASFRFFHEHGAHCDCEILFNLAAE